MMSILELNGDDNTVNTKRQLHCRSAES